MISMGVFIGASTRIYDRATGRDPLRAGAGGIGSSSWHPPSADGKYALYCAVIVKQVDAKTRAKTEHQRAAAGRLTAASRRRRRTPTMAMKRLLELMAEKKASDIFISGRRADQASRSTASTMPINQQIVTPDTVRALMTEILTERQLARVRGRTSS